ARQHGGNIATVDSIALLHGAGPEVLLDERDGAAVLLDERHLRRTAADRLDPDRARSGESIEDTRAVDARRQDVEQRLAELVGRRTQSVPAGGFETTAFQATGDNPHGRVTRFRSIRTARATAARGTRSTP